MLAQWAGHALRADADHETSPPDVVDVVDVNDAVNVTLPEDRLEGHSLTSLTRKIGVNLTASMFSVRLCSAAPSRTAFRLLRAESRISALNIIGST